MPKLLKNDFILRNTAAETGQSGNSQNETGLQLKLKLIQMIGVQSYHSDNLCDMCWVSFQWFIYARLYWWDE